MRDRLAPIAARLRDSRAQVRPVSQVLLRLPASSGARFNNAVDDILRWIDRRAGDRLPEAAWKRKSFELQGLGAQRAAAVALDEPKYWTARVDDADKNVPLRTWVVEAGVGLDTNGDTLVGVRLLCAVRGKDEPYQRSIPAVVRAIIRSGIADVDGLQVSAKARLVATQDDVRMLTNLMLSKSRQNDVIVLALRDRSEDTSEVVIDADALQDAVLGISHVFVLTGPASYLLSDIVGKQLSVFMQAVRTYRPGFTLGSDPYDHGLTLPSKILEQGAGGPADFMQWLVDQTLGRSAHAPGQTDTLPPFNTVRQLAAAEERRQALAAGKGSDEMARLFQADNDQLRKELEEQGGESDLLLAEAERERDAAIEDASAAKSTAIARLHYIRTLERRLAEAGSQRPATPIPDTLTDLEEWCAEHMEGSVHVMGRAFQAVRKIEYADPALVYKSLILLRDFYVPMRAAPSKTNLAAYNAALLELGLEESLTGAGSRLYGDQYTVQYGSGRRELDRHLKGANSRDKRYGFRVYFFWEATDELVIVGHLPTHLSNRLT